ncbi:MAG: tetratricopeptide repeat protein, partial [Bacteroidota bacterium]
EKLELSTPKTNATKNETPIDLMRMQETNRPPVSPSWSPSQRLFDLLFGFGSLLRTFSLDQIEGTLPPSFNSPAQKFVAEGPAMMPPSKPEPSINRTVAMNLESNHSTPTPAPKSSFSSWIKQFQSPQTNLRLDSIMESSRPNTAKVKKKKQEKKVNRAETLAQRSLRENHDLASETLAMILEKQGHHEKAIRMYERLGLIFPEKSSFFAEKIKNLKKR